MIAAVVAGLEFGWPRAAYSDDVVVDVSIGPESTETSPTGPSSTSAGASATPTGPSGGGVTGPSATDTGQPPDDGGSLPRTGAIVGGLLIVGFGLVVAGACLRRRRRETGI
ncbi:MAG: LPXTG cell wall anchor domain-containing protein [Bifidobacteriaceae bacterium]|nr:LPXTG cell wall anchor domain-containing protein [Bifidobacteriaceae bacterium]